MALQRAVYRPRDAEHTVLHQVVAEHLEAFLGAAAEAGDGAARAAARSLRPSADRHSMTIFWPSTYP